MQKTCTLTLLTILFVAALPHQIQAQSPASSPLPLLEDPAADVILGISGQKAPAGSFDTLDLRAFSIAEDTDAFHFTATLTDVRRGQDSRDDGTAVYVQFDHNGRTFQLGMGHLWLGNGEYLPIELDYRDTPTSAWNQMYWHDPAATVDPAAKTISADVPRGDLADAMGANPYKGRQFTNLQVRTTELVAFEDEHGGLLVHLTPQTGEVYDYMPDSGVSKLAYDVQVGPKQEGHAYLSSTEPFRASNGEATTILYQAFGKNTGPAADRFILSAKDVPHGWNVTLPEPILSLEAGASQEFPVAVTVPFNHVHGSTLEFTLEMASQSDRSTVGRLYLGIRYLATPQPAGHHNLLYFHSRPVDPLNSYVGPACGACSGYLTMNALETDLSDSAVATPPSGYGIDTSQTPAQDMYGWCIRLNPGLQIGLDFIEGQAGHVNIPVHNVLPLQGAYLTGRLILQSASSSFRGQFACWNDSALVELARLNATSPADLAPNTDTVLKADLSVLPAADKVPYVRGQDLLLQLDLHGVSVPDVLGSGTDEPSIVPGGQVVLPLLEYHDAVSAVFNTTASALTALGPQERRANPGATVVFPLSLANAGEADADFSLEIKGANHEWVHAPAAMTVPGHATVRVQVVVRVPTDAKAGEAADVLVESQQMKDASAAPAILRLLVTVDSTPGLPDDSALVVLQDNHHASPGMAPVVLCGLLALVALARRRSQ